jgi:prefoldin subunit 5
MEERDLSEKTQPEVVSLADYEKILKEKIKTEVRTYLNKVLTAFGITNVLIFLSIIAYITVTIPEKAIEIAINREKEEISKRIQTLQQDVDKAFKTLGNFEIEIKKLQQNIDDTFETIEKLKKDIPSLEEQIKNIKQSVSKLASASTEEINKAAQTLTLLKDYQIQKGADLLAKVESVRQFASSVDDKVNRILKGEEIAERFSVKEISILDTQRKERVFLGVRKEKGAGLFLLDSSGKGRVALYTGQTDDLPNIILQNSKGTNRVQLYENESGYAGLELRDSNGKGRMILNTNPKDGTGTLSLRDSKENRRVQLYENESGYAGLELRDSNGKGRMILNTNPKDGTGLLELKDSKENSRVRLYEKESGYAGLGLIDSNGKFRMTLTTDGQNGSPAIEFKDSTGKVIKNY